MVKTSVCCSYKDFMSSMSFGVGFLSPLVSVASLLRRKAVGAGFNVRLHEGIMAP